MRRLTLPCALLLGVALACRGKEAKQTTSVTDTASTTVAPAATPDTAPSGTAARAFAFDQRRDFAANIRQQLAAVDQQIDELSAQAKSKGGAVSDRALANIRAARRAVSRNLQRVDAATAGTWEEIQRAVNDAVDHLHGAIEEAQPK